jgi:hypothetical protein
MPITMPDFKNPHCFWLRVCGVASKAGTVIQELPKGERRIVAILKTDRGEAHVRMILGGTTVNHVHFDFYCPEIVAKRLKRRPDIEQDKMVELPHIQQIMGQLSGMDIELALEAGYKAKIEELPATGIIRSFFFETKMGNVAVRLDGAMFAIQGAPIRKILWNLQSEGGIGVTLEADSIKTTICDDYLISVNNIAEQAFNSFVLGKVGDEPK